MSLENQSFVVVGGAKISGIGFCFVKQLLAIGVKKIAIFDVVDTNDAINELKNEFPENTVQFHKVDVRNKVDIENAFKKVVEAFGYVDVMANVAGIAGESRIEDVIQINLLGVMYGTFTAINHMSIENGGRGGTIINVSSVAGLDPFAVTPVYCASKFAIVGFTRSLAEKELAAAFGIRFIVVCPGFTQTTILDTPDALFRESMADIASHWVEKYGMQTATDCGQSILKVLKESENGSVWILNRGEQIPVQFPSYFKEELITKK